MEFSDCHKMEQPSTGYDFEVIGDTGKDFECAICMLLLRKAVELPCAHVFCKVCLEHWQDNPMERDAVFLCPSCKKMYHREQVVDSKFLNRYVKTSLQVKCRENKFGCQWEGKIIDYTQHENKCIYKTINCNFVGCKERVMVMNLRKHQSNCVYRSGQCNFCLLKVQFIKWKSHHDSCDKFPVNCPNDGCSIIIARKEVFSHMQNGCPYQMINCQYQRVGCQHQLQRRFKTQHQDECLHDHMNMLLNGFNMTSQELSSRKKKLRKTQEDLRNTGERLQTTEEKCQKIEEKLIQTEERLQQTENQLQNTEGKLAITNKNHQETKIILNQTQEELQNTNQDLLVANKVISKIRNHDREIDQLCFQLAKITCRKRFDAIVGLESLATMDHNEIPDFNIAIHTPDVWTELHKMLEEKVNETKTYTNRFIDVMDIMEAKKLYGSSEKEIFVKVDVTNYKIVTPSFNDYHSFKAMKISSGVVYSSSNILLREVRGTTIEIIFSLPGWHNNNAKTFILHPKISDPKLLNNQGWNFINEDMMTKGTIIVKAVLQ